MKNEKLKTLISRMLMWLLPIIFFFACSETSQPDYLNPDLTFEDRADDLISRMTVEEKISQLRYDAPAIDRLGVPAFNWWNECLHGVARSGKATVFPQAIGLATTWDTTLIYEMAGIISDEARAKYHDYFRRGKHGIFQGLTFWSPNINIFRDPRWGRGQETYGEDPYLTALIGTSFIRGLQGNHPKYLKTVATVKHFAVHSGPEPDRHAFNAEVSDRDLYQTYLPQFRHTVMKGKVESVMCAYNLYQGSPCCGNTFLLKDVLRDAWGFDGHVVSDCWALRDFITHQTTAGSDGEAGSIAIKAGTDLNCGVVYRKLGNSLDSSMIVENNIDVALKRLMLARFKLGMFDPPEMVPWSDIPVSILDDKKHRGKSLQLARESMVLLKNDGLLPIDKSKIKKVAVIGPNADSPEVMFGNYNGTPVDPVTPLRAISEKLAGKAEVVFAQGCDWAENMPAMHVIPNAYLFTEENGQTVNGLKGEYYDNFKMEGEPVLTRIDNEINFNWWDGAPIENLDDDNFAIRWTGKLIPPKTGMYYIGGYGTEYEVRLNDSLLASLSSIYQASPGYSKMYLEKGRSYNLDILQKENEGESEIRLIWNVPEEKKEHTALEVAKNADVVVMCMGITPQLEGEEKKVPVEGFFGGDRIKLELPKIQQELIKKVHAVNPNIVLVLMNGSAVSINWSQENLPAVLEAWYPGQDGGTAIADVLFGDYNPAGRLPVTVYKSEDQLPPFSDYNMQGRTYKYFEDEPLYPFGFGMSYTNFAYSDLEINDSFSTTEKVEIEVSIKNTGDYDGDEVVQVYASHKDDDPNTAIRTLVGFQRVHLKKGESKTLTFSIEPRQLSIIDEKGDRVLNPGEIMFSVGGGQPLKKYIALNPYLEVAARITGKPTMFKH